MNVHRDIAELAVIRGRLFFYARHPVKLRNQKVGNPPE